MGGHQSHTRRVTIQNDDANGVIKLSDELVQRLKGSEGVRNRGSYVDGGWPGQGQGQQFVQYPPGAPPPPFLYEPSLTSIQLRQNVVNELKKNDEYWEKRIVDLQKNHEKIQEIMEYEYNKALDEMGYNEKGKSKKNKPIPCQETKKMVLKCYKAHPNETMLCAKEVQAFAECVDLKRACVVEESKG